MRRSKDNIDRNECARALRYEPGVAIENCKLCHGPKDRLCGVSNPDAVVWRKHCRRSGIARLRHCGADQLLGVLRRRLELKLNQLVWTRICLRPPGPARKNHRPADEPQPGQQEPENPCPAHRTPLSAEKWRDFTPAQRQFLSRFGQGCKNFTKRRYRRSIGPGPPPPAGPRPCPRASSPPPGSFSTSAQTSTAECG